MEGRGVSTADRVEQALRGLWLADLAHRALLAEPFTQIGIKALVGHRRA